VTFVVDLNVLSFQTFRLVVLKAMMNRMMKYENENENERTLTYLYF